MYRLEQGIWEYKGGSDYPTWIPILTLERETIKEGKELIRILSDDMQENPDMYDDFTSYFKLCSLKKEHHYIAKHFPRPYKL